jgi:hypothetical protein
MYVHTYIHTYIRMCVCVCVCVCVVCVCFWGGVRMCLCMYVCRYSASSQPTIVLLLFLQKQSLAFAVYLFGIGTLHTGPGLKKKTHVIMLSP